MRVHTALAMAAFWTDRRCTAKDARCSVVPSCSPVLVILWSLRRDALRGPRHSSSYVAFAVSLLRLQYSTSARVCQTSQLHPARSCADERPQKCETAAYECRRDKACNANGRGIRRRVCWHGQYHRSPPGIGLGRMSRPPPVYFFSKSVTAQRKKVALLRMASSGFMWYSNNSHAPSGSSLLLDCGIVVPSPAAQL